MEKRPPFRKLRGYAFDPSMSLQLDTAGINEITYKIPWEELDKGPDGEYVTVVDRDPPGNAFYHPVDLNDQNILARDGLEPSETNPQFHQQMVYAVAMYTIKNFEKAIGRKIQWSPSLEDVTKYVMRTEANVESKRPVYNRRFVEKLILYPHAFRAANAYYSADRKAILFGYFNATPASADLHMPGSIVFSCLSHDIIAHEVTHAILDGMFSRFMESTHPDVPAFHEALADIVALMQHFTFPEVLNHELAKMKATFNAESLLGKLAIEFAQASGGHGSLRDGIGTYKNNKWVRATPSLDSYRTIFECHERGSILVAAVFDAFISIYNQRSVELIRIATGGTGVLPEGELNFHLIQALAGEAAKSASHVLNMCIRALDYCPPVDITFGDYLRAIITADAEIVADDKHNYRIAFIDAFRKRGIYPEGLNNLSIESLTYNMEDVSKEIEEFSKNNLPEFLENFKNRISYMRDRREIFNLTRRFISSRKLSDAMIADNIRDLYSYFNSIFKSPRQRTVFENLTGLAFTPNFKKLHIDGYFRDPSQPSLEIQDIRLNNRVGPDGNIQNQIIIIILQSCGVKVEYKEKDDEYDVKTFQFNPVDDFGEGAFQFRGGCTLIFDLNTKKFKHAISKPILDMNLLVKKKPEYTVNRSRAIMQYRSQFGDYAEKTGIAILKDEIEPLAYIHHTNPATL